MIRSWLRYFRNLALAFWIGKLLFFGAIFAPRVFKVLPRVQAGELQAALFPPYFLAGFLCGLVILATLGLEDLLGIGASFEARFRKQRTWAFWLVAVATLITAYSLWGLTPDITRYQPLVLGLDPATVDPAIQAHFNSLHAWSVRLNGSVLMMLLAVLALL